MFILRLALRTGFEHNIPYSVWNTICKKELFIKVLTLYDTTMVCKTNCWFFIVIAIVLYTPLVYNLTFASKWSGLGMLSKDKNGNYCRTNSSVQDETLCILCLYRVLFHRHRSRSERKYCTYVQKCGFCMVQIAGRQEDLFHRKTREDAPMNLQDIFWVLRYTRGRSGLKAEEAEERAWSEEVQERTGSIEQQSIDGFPFPYHDGICACPPSLPEPTVVWFFQQPGTNPYFPSPENRTIFINSDLLVDARHLPFYHLSCTILISSLLLFLYFSKLIFYFSFYFHKAPCHGFGEWSYLRKNKSYSAQSSAKIDRWWLKNNRLVVG